MSSKDEKKDDLVSKIEERFNNKFREYMALKNKVNEMEVTGLNPIYSSAVYKLKKIENELEIIDAFVGYSTATHLHDFGAYSKQRMI